MKLRNELYLGLFSYMPVKGVGSQNEFRRTKAIAYIPVFGPIVCVVMSILVSRGGKEEADPERRRVAKIQNTLFRLRATLSLVPPLLLITEGITTLVDAILRLKKHH